MASDQDSDGAPPGPVGLHSLPEEVVGHIFTFLSLEDSSSFARTSTRYHSIAQSNNVFGRFSCAVDAHRHYDVTVPARCGVRRLEITGQAYKVAAAVSAFAAAAASAQHSVCGRLCDFCAMMDLQPLDCRRRQGLTDPTGHARPSLSRCVVKFSRTARARLCLLH